MRVISGTLRGRKLEGFNIEGTRPTMDRVKESVFASIQEYIPNSIVLDLFAGSGNLGIEAISNGCSKCYFVDNNYKCINIIKKNLINFNILSKAILIENDYLKALESFNKKGQVFNIIFIDPPYKDNILIDIMNNIEKNNLLSEKGIIILEYNLDTLSEDIKGYILLKKKKYGDKYISIYQKK